MDRIGILGGTFDPIHIAHVDMALTAKRELELDSVTLMPTGAPRYKRVYADARDRLEMARLAAQTVGLGVSDADNGDAYTADAIKALCGERPDAKWYFIMGADAFTRLHHWRGIDELLTLCAFVCLGRPGVADIDAAVADMQSRGAEVITLQHECADISSADIRRRANMGLDITGMTAGCVVEYINARGLYLSCMTESEILAALKVMLKEGRYLHTLGVADTACHLAKIYDVPIGKARLTGLLHDCAKYMPVDEMRKLATDADDMELSNTELMHAPAGVILARDKFGVHDPAILQAIRRHTLGGANMSLLDIIVYVADFIEPYREPFPGLEAVRRAADNDIYSAAKMCAESTLEYLKARGETPHTRTLEMLQTIK